MEKTYEKEMFDYAAYKELLDHISQTRRGVANDKEAMEKMDDAMEIIHDAVEACGAYVTTVDNTENSIYMAYNRLEGAALVQAVENADRARRRAHEAAIAMTSALSRLSEGYIHKPVFLGSFGNREEVADFCLEITAVLFQNRKR